MGKSGYENATMVAPHLGLGDGDSELLALAGQRWPQWVAARPELAVVPDGAQGLRAWLTSVPQQDADRVLLGLAALAATDGGDDRVAASALAWALLPGACVLAGRLRGASDRIGELVAAQLWVEARTFPWQRLTKVAANVLMNTRVAVLQECGVPTQRAARADRTWSQTHVVDPTIASWSVLVQDVSGPADTGEAAFAQARAETLLEVLDWGCQTNVITVQDRTLLVSLAEAAYRCSRLAPRASGGLMGDVPSQQVGEQHGVSATTVKRRALRSLRALSSAASSSGRAISA